MLHYLTGRQNLSGIILSVIWVLPEKNQFYLIPGSRRGIILVVF
jgi:hypothetical protein